MAPLPKERFSEVRPFLQVGLDFAGPFQIKESLRKRAPINKAYMCLFVCLSTKALHLETVSALTTTALIAALDRFTSRRGLPLTLLSDHERKFVGASNYLRHLQKFLIQNEEELTRWSAPKNIEWKFIPPRAPHFGGIWEAGVKSAKKLLQGSVGSHPFTFKELDTIFTRIEGILNSRPLCALNEDSDCCSSSDCWILTPAHFLIGSSLSVIPEPTDDLLDTSPHNRWEAVQWQVKSIWNRWCKEYLHTLQQRGEWRKKTPNLKVGDLVIMIDHRNIMASWPVARITEVHPGKDGAIRTVSIRTPSGSIFIRPMVALAPLFPLENVK